MHELAESAAGNRPPLVSSGASGFRPGITHELRKTMRLGFASYKDIARMVDPRVADRPNELASALNRIQTFLIASGVIIISPELQKEFRKAVKPQKVNGRAQRPQERENGESEPHWIWLYEKNLTGLYLKDIGPYKRLEREEYHHLSDMVQRHGDIHSRNRLVTTSLRLPLKFAWFHAAHPDNELLDELDLIQEANIGLIRAAEHYQYRDDCTWSTYAVFWIKQAMHRAVENDGTLVRFPIHRRERWRKVRNAAHQFQKRMGRSPTFQELAEAMSLSVEDIEAAFAEMRMSVISLDQPLDQNHHKSDNEDFTVGDTIEDEQIKSPEEIVIAQEQSTVALRAVAKMLSGFPERDRKIFRARYGLDGTRAPKKLEEIGQTFGITRERVRQIVQKVWLSIETTNSELYTLSGMRESILRCIGKVDEEEVERPKQQGPRQCLTCGSQLSVYNTGDRCFRHPLPPRAKKPETACGSTPREQEQPIPLPEADV